MKKKSFRFDKKVCVGNTLNLGICSKFLGNFEGILGNPGEIPHVGWKTLGIYREPIWFITKSNMYLNVLFVREEVKIITAGCSQNAAAFN